MGKKMGYNSAECKKREKENDHDGIDAYPEPRQLRGLETGLRGTRMTAAKAAELVRDGDTVVSTGGANWPYAVDEAWRSVCAASAGHH